MKKFFLLSLLVVALAAMCIPFLPPVYSRLTKPMWKNYADNKEWYDTVDPEDVDQVRDYCKRRGYIQDFYVLINFCIPSGKNASSFIDES